MRITLIVVALLATACVRTRTDPVTGRMDVDVENPMKKGESWSGTLKGMGPWASIAGTVSAVTLNGETTTTIKLSNARPGAVYPWHLHDGECATGGPVVGAPSAYAPLVVGSTGTAEGTARITGTINEAKKYHVNVHASAAEMSTIVACADIRD